MEDDMGEVGDESRGCDGSSEPCTTWNELDGAYCDVWVGVRVLESRCDGK